MPPKPFLQSSQNRQLYLLTFLTILLTALILHLNGRLWICACHKIYLWVGDPWSSDNSQHLFDPYSFSHFQHGLVFFFALRWLLKEKAPVALLFFLAITLECGWEILENSAFIIDRYRHTASQGYIGDTVINSVFDVLSCALGFLWAKRLGKAWTIAAFVIIEIAMIVAYRDSLLLNILMLGYPFEAIKVWQIEKGT